MNEAIQRGEIAEELDSIYNCIADVNSMIDETFVKFEPVLSNIVSAEADNRVKIPETKKTQLGNKLYDINSSLKKIQERLLMLNKNCGL